MIPFYIFYSMFGLQRIGDLVWASGDIRARGFLLGGTAGRTTLNGEGLQHEDGHSQVLSSVIPNCVSYDPTFAYEVAVIIQDGLRRMMENQEDVFYYITLMNENYPHPGLPEGAREGILKGMYRLVDARAAKDKAPRVQLMGSGTILREVIAAGELLAKDWGVAADVWSCPSFTELRREGMAAARWNLLHPTEKPRALVRRAVPRRHRRAGRSPRPTTCAPTPTRSASSSRAATRCWAPTASAAATRARTCAASSRWTATTSRSRR